MPLASDLGQALTDRLIAAPKDHMPDDQEILLSPGDNLILLDGTLGMDWFLDRKSVV